MRILIVEDELRMLELLRKGLYEHGFTVMTAADGEGGLETATAHELDAIVLDIGPVSYTHLPAGFRIHRPWLSFSFLVGRKALFTVR